MPLSRKDEQIIKHLIDYCKEVDLAIATFKADKSQFINYISRQMWKGFHNLP